METQLTVRDQVSLFALMLVARPITNRELLDLAGLKITAEVRRRANRDVELISTTKRGSTYTHKLTAEGRNWCESALVAGRPDEAKFPAGALYAVLDSIGQYLVRADLKFDEFFQADLENWIRAIYAELTVRRTPGSWVKLSALRPWLEHVPRDVVDAELDRMIEQPDVHLMANLNRFRLEDEDRQAAVEIGGEMRHVLMIGAS
ncbi:hypothetical protein [Amycolatopsis sp. 195334CR]|uniref:hypothetical protein n=1 Tax=Amycolatopsis sp. 195334CR TaxID=2814588 RepID=UPI001A8C19E4|nr:hypothetical protein [Amycolatopsis sp. 195334CR]MBN6042288.1 hypothetical protein [Amycolatopsis sp. 195334CR]